MLSFSTSSSRVSWCSYLTFSSPKLPGARCLDSQLDLRGFLFAASEERVSNGSPHSGLPHGPVGRGHPGTNLPKGLSVIFFFPSWVIGAAGKSGKLLTEPCLAGELPESTHPARRCLGWSRSGGSEPETCFGLGWDVRARCQRCAVVFGNLPVCPFAVGHLAKSTPKRPGNSSDILGDIQKQPTRALSRSSDLGPDLTSKLARGVGPATPRGPVQPPEI